MSKNPKIESLDNMFWIVQLDTFMNKFDKEMSKENTKLKKWLKIGGIPLLVSFGISAITLSFIPAVIGISYFGAVAIIKNIKEDIAYDKYLREKYSIEPKPNFNKESDVADFEFLNEPIITVKAEDYHSDFYKQRLKEAATKKRFTLINSEGKVINGEDFEPEPEIPGFLDKEETMIRVSDEYRVYQIAYNLPDLTIKNKEWEILFDTIYHKLEEISSEEKFYDKMSFLLRYVIAYALINKQNEINFKSFINQIPRLEILGFNKKDIKSIETKLKEYLPRTQVIKLDFASLRKTK